MNVTMINVHFNAAHSTGDHWKFWLNELIREDILFLFNFSLILLSVVFLFLYFFWYSLKSIFAILAFFLNCIFTFRYFIFYIYFFGFTFSLIISFFCNVLKYSLVKTIFLCWRLKKKTAKSFQTKYWFVFLCSSIQ